MTFIEPIDIEIKKKIDFPLYRYAIIGISITLFLLIIDEDGEGYKYLGNPGNIFILFFISSLFLLYSKMFWNFKHSFFRSSIGRITIAIFCYLLSYISFLIIFGSLGMLFK